MTAKVCGLMIRGRSNSCVFSRCGLEPGHKGDHAERHILKNGKEILRYGRELNENEKALVAYVLDEVSKK